MAKAKDPPGKHEKRNVAIATGASLVIGGIIGCLICSCRAQAQPQQQVAWGDAYISNGGVIGNSYSMELLGWINNLTSTSQTATIKFTSSVYQGAVIGSYTTNVTVPAGGQYTLAGIPFQNPAGGFVTGTEYQWQVQLLIGSVKQGSTYTWTGNGPSSYSGPVLS